ncbi:threonine aldolase family protein [Acidiluteibacter ferrifornacis]|uniref:Threonine aldolase n=1 Tax=Acidiluteibacter ferrifornacis TaxID=2692424 RepID=A0A6N9NHY5_9FLAO|nr:GntG family PLP-dependent aldolase [Acidiluteibacter ferrifornacis]NBG66296.1 threonine aldolase [Acidiluteibacter ferrifornacis]
MIIDLRSDTVTQPTPAMLSAMMQAVVGDDVLGDDPTVRKLEVYAADLFGMEEALFCPSGTMTNQIAIKVHTNSPGEVICSDIAHIYRYEGGGIGFNSGLSTRLLDGDRGQISAESVVQNINPDDVHAPPTQLVSIENTCNKGGGSIYDFEEVKAIAAICKEHQIPFHLDGARLFNAIVETEQTPKDYGEQFDSISICLSKGLGAPVGSLLLGNNSFIKKSRRIRKILGGGMRQAGFLAAAGLFALTNNIDRLKDDHELAKKIAEILDCHPLVEHVLEVETNIVIFVHSERITTANFLTQLKENGILAVQMGHQQIRLVTHLSLPKNVLQLFKNAIEKIQ